jgi:hypothetical protein
MRALITLPFVQRVLAAADDADDGVPGDQIRK